MAFDNIKTQVRCYRKCIYNTFHKSNCGYCMRKEIQLTNEGCMDFSEIKKCIHSRNIRCPNCGNNEKLDKILQEGKDDINNT